MRREYRACPRAEPKGTALDIKEGLDAAAEPFERQLSAGRRSAKVKVHLCGPRVRLPGHVPQERETEEAS